VNSINSQIPRLSTLEIAAMGLEKVKAARNEEKEATCDFFLAQVDKQGNEIEKALAHMALTQFSSEEIESYGIPISLKTGILSSIAHGVSGPVGMTIARAALEGISRLPRDHGKMPLARTFVKALADHGSDYERETASRSLTLSENASERGQGAADLKLLEMAAKGLPLSQAEIFAEVGLGLMSETRYSIDSSSVSAARGYLEAAAEKGTEQEKTIARTLFTLLPPLSTLKGKRQWEDAFQVINLALTSIVSDAGVPRSAALINLGLQVREPYRMSILNTLSKSPGNQALSAVSGALIELLGRIPNESERAVMGNWVFEELQDTAASTVDAALVRHALKAREHTYFLRDKEGGRALIGTAFLKALAGHATMPENSRSAREALDACAPQGIFNRLFHRKKSAEIAEIQSQAFKTILGNLKTVELQAELQREMEKSVAERVLGTGGSDSHVPVGAVEDSEQFIEVDGIKIPKKQWEYMR
jgi:hypothetical protein